MTINYKVFAAGDTLSANDVLTYLENQAVIKVDAASELPTLASTYPDVKVAYAVDTDKVYVNDDGTFVALVTADGTVTLSNLTLTGNLTVQGTTTTIDSTTIAIKDKFVFEGSTADAHETTLQVVEPTADRTISLPDSSGTVALTSQIPSVASFITASSTDPLTNKTLNLASNTVTGTLAQFNTAVSDADLASLAGAETLTNKTIDLASNTLTTTLAQLNTAITDENVASRDGIETLTNKTISGASNTLSNIGNASLTNSSITINGTPVSLGGTATISSYSLPPQTGNSGKFLTTNGTAESWGTVDLTTKTDKATLTTTGDIYYASSASTPARLGIGSANQVLTVSGGIPSWATPASGGMTLLSTTPLTGTGIQVTNISQDYVNLFISVTEVDMANMVGHIRIRPNNLTTNFFGAGTYLYQNEGGGTALSTVAANDTEICGPLQLARASDGGSMNMSLIIYNYASTTATKAGSLTFGYRGTQSSSNNVQQTGGAISGYYNTFSPITSLNVTLLGLTGAAVLTTQFGKTPNVKIYGVR